MTMLYGCMQDEPLLISMLIDYAAENHPDREIISKMPDGSVHRYGYAQARSRAKRLAKALLRHGIQVSDRVGTLANNSFRHFECFYGISGIAYGESTAFRWPDQVHHFARRRSDIVCRSTVR